MIDTSSVDRDVEFDRFVALVRQMREAQRSYFQVRNKAMLKAAKALEREVDDAVDHHHGIHQQTMF